ncbi:hypothetical protein KWS_0123450, partial [Xanthomonas vasicola pv. musacearum NCPPB 4384]
DSGVLSAPVHGHLRSAPQVRGDVRFVWSGDTVGQGFGINPDIGGMRIYNAMRERNPDFFLHSGDTIYADNPIPAELTVEDVEIDGRSGVLTVTLRDLDGVAQFRQPILPHGVA